MTPTLSELGPLTLDLCVVLGACILLVLDLALPHGRKRTVGWVALGPMPIR